MNKRQIQILKFLLKSNKFFDYKFFSEKFHVSERTIRNDIDEIEQLLLEHDIKLTKDRKLGVSIQAVDYEEKEYLIKEILKNREFYSAEERLNIIIQMLLINEAPITIKDIISRTGASKSSTLKDLDKCEEWFKKHNIKLIRRKKYGFKIYYDEFNWRMCVVDYLRKYLHEIDFSEAYKHIKLNNFAILKIFMNDFVNQLIKDVDLISVKRFIEVYETEMKVEFTNEFFLDLFFYIAISINRIASKKLILVHKRLNNTTSIQKQKELIDNQIEILEKANNIFISESEKQHLLLLFLSSKKYYQGDKEAYDIEKELALKFINIVEIFLNVDLQKDKELLKNLIMHIKPTIHRIKYGIIIKNPLLNEIKTHFPEIYKASTYASKIINEYLGKEINEDEIGFLSMHIGASIERIYNSKNQIRMIKIAVVCSSGIGTSNFLATRLLNKFSNIVIESVNTLDEIVQLKTKDIDLIISTIPINYDLDKKVVVVNPLLKDKDAEKIDYEIKKLCINRNSNNFTIIEDIIDIVSKVCTVNDYRLLYKKLENYFNTKVTESEEDTILLKDIIDEKNIELNVEVESWEESIQYVGQLLLKNNCIEKRYIDEMIRTKKEIGPFMVIAPGIAMPHARPEDGVLKICMGIITLKNPVKFGSEENDPVKLVIALGAIDSKSHLRALSDLITFLDNEENIKKVYACKEAKELVDLIVDFENQLCRD